MPSCWKFEAIHNAVPQISPPSKRVRRSPASLVWIFFLLRIYRNGTRTIAPINERIALKVNVPRRCEPTLCATKAVHQIAAVTRSRNIPRIEFLFFILLAFRLLLIYWISIRYLFLYFKKIPVFRCENCQKNNEKCFR